MITIQGKGVSKGIARGPLYFFRRPEPVVHRRQAQDPAGERERLNRAREQADILEANTDKSLWPYPTYSDLLFY